MALVKRGNIGELNRIAAELKGIGESLAKFADEEIVVEDVLALGRNARDLAKFLTPDAVKRALDRPPHAAPSEVQDAFEEFRIAFSQETAEAILRHVLERFPKEMSRSDFLLGSSIARDARPPEGRQRAVTSRNTANPAG